MSDRMKKKSITILLVIICVIALSVLLQKMLIVSKETENSSSFKAGDTASQQLAYSTVQILEKTSDEEESSYLAGGELPAADFSVAGHILSDKIAQEWETYDRMTEFERLASSKLWGCISFETDTWEECEHAIGFTIHNPLESLDWLNKTGYFGMESANPDMPVKHIQTNVNAAQSSDRKISEITVTAGYNAKDIRITVSAAVSAKGGTYTLGGVCNGYADFEEMTMTTESGIPVLIVTTDETNNKGYYNGDYYDPTAYWIKDNVFYSLRVFGDETDKEEIQDTLFRILEEV